MDVRAPFCPAPPPLTADYSHAAWRATAPHAIDRLWNGTPAPAIMATTARLFWTLRHLWIGFECRYGELDIDTDADVSSERIGLWDRDVCEAFIWNPLEPQPDSYKEFEVAPTGQWCDLAIHHPRVEVDVHWTSGMETAAAIDQTTQVWRAVMRLPFSAFESAPTPGDTWRANLFRIGRAGGARQYLAYAPTGTPAPDFHQPDAFVPLVFTVS